LSRVKKPTKNLLAASIRFAQHYSRKSNMASCSRCSRPNTSPRFRDRFDKNQDNFYFLVPPLRPLFGTLKMSKRGRRRWNFFKKRSDLFVSPLCPRFAFFTVSCSCCGPAAIDFKYEVNMKARQLLFFKGEAKQTVISTSCGPALTYLKMRSK
jgi:hypothetical protein